MRKTNAEYQRIQDQKKRNAGLVRFGGWATPEHKALIKRLEKALMARMIRPNTKKLDEMLTACEAANKE